jgi:P27 family predicted phage terminase small subunit
MNAQQRELWRETVDSAPRGLLSTMDRGTLTAYVVACDGMIEATKKVNEFGAVVKGPNTGFAVQSPFESIKNKQAELLMKAAGELGFTPIARSRIAKLEPVSAPKILSDEGQGKKEKAAKEAVTAQAGTDWEALLPGTAAGKPN